jgi:hypothetical protein
MDSVRVQAIQLRRKNGSTTHLQAQFKLRLPNIKEPAQFHLAYVTIRPDSSRIGAGDRQKIQSGLADWQRIFAGPYRLIWDDGDERRTLVMAFADSADGTAREHRLGWPRDKSKEQPATIERAVRSRLLEIAQVRIEINWITAEVRFRELVIEVAQATAVLRAASSSGGQP